MKTVVFDVNETLLDLASMRPRFDEAFGSSELVGPWFSQLLRHSLVATITDSYAPFDVLALDALFLVTAKAGISSSDAELRHVASGMRHLDPHPDVVPAITKLKASGLRVATLTNSPPDMLSDQLTNAGIIDLFDATLSVDPVRKFKPHPDVYHSGAERLEVSVSNMRLVAAHDWDVTGAIRAGASAAFVARPGMRLSPASATPDIVEPDLESVAEAIIARDAG